MQYEYAEPSPRTLEQYCRGGLNGTFKEEGEGEVWKFGPNRSKIRSSSSGVALMQSVDLCMSPENE